MSPEPRSVRIGLLQGRGEASREEALAATMQGIRDAAAQGAQVVCTQELFLSPYFCRAQDPRHFDLAEPIPGPTTTALAPLARELGVVLVASLFERRAPGLHHNTATVIDADGTLLGLYRKMHIPQDPCFEEKYYFSPGDTGFKAWKTRHGTIGVVICWDQWYPEAARLTALQGARIIFAPTAIGWLPGEKQGTGIAQREAWITVQRGHAIANGCHWAAVNRTGIEGSTEFWGSSFIADGQGRMLAEAGVSSPEILLADCDLRAQEEHRRMWPFFRDRRIDAFEGLQRRFGDG